MVVFLHFEGCDLGRPKWWRRPMFSRRSETVRRTTARNEGTVHLRSRPERCFTVYSQRVKRRMAVMQGYGMIALAG